MNAIDDLTSAKRRFHPLAKWSLGIAIATIPVSIISATFVPPFLTALIGGGLAALIGIIGFFAGLRNSRQFRGA
jgi:hypothetical protein